MSGGRQANVAKQRELVDMVDCASTTGVPPPDSPDITMTGLSDHDGRNAHPAVVTFEGAKGLSAQHVFLIGLHEHELPRDVTHIDDLEVCKCLVALIRVKKKCSLLTTNRFGSDFRTPSEFLFWIDNTRYERKIINADSWRT